MMQECTDARLIMVLEALILEMPCLLCNVSVLMSMHSHMSAFVVVSSITVHNFVQEYYAPKGKR